MGTTTIDSLAIEIQTNSGGAVSGIEQLAGALEKIKKSTISSTSVKNLQALTSALKELTPVSSNANKLNSLADAMEKLKSVGSIGSGVKKLSESLATLKNVDYTSLEKVATAGPLFDKIGASLGSLSAVKPGGFGTMVNSLEKIGKVTDSLDDGVIARFADRVKRLTEHLEPLSTKLTTVQTGLRGVNSSAKSAGNGVKDFGGKVNATTLNMASMITVVQGVTAALAPMVRLLSNVISEAIEWDGIASRFGRGFGDQADETYAWVQRLNKEMGISTQQFMQYSSIYANMLTSFGVAHNDATKMAVGYVELTYDIWAGYNDIYKSFEEAADAVRSAVSGEVEPIRRASFTIVESQLEITAANHGLEISLEKATEAQKSYLRYLTLVDQAQSQNLIGTYAKEMNTAEGMMRTFNQQLKSLGQTFGSLFIPILVGVMPWLQAFVSLLTDATIAVARFFGIEIKPINFGDSSGLEGLSQGLDGAGESAKEAQKAVEELKNATIGIDELNVISPPSSGSGSGAGGGDEGGGFGDLDIGSLWDEAIFDSIQSKVNDIKDTISGFFDEWETEIGVISGLLGALALTKLLGNLSEAISLGDTFKGTLDNIGKIAVSGIVITLQYTLANEFFSNYIEGEKFKDYVLGVLTSAIATYILYKQWGTGGIAIGLAVTAYASLKAVFDNGGVDSAESAAVALTGLASAAGALGLAWKALDPVITWMKEYAAAAKLMTPEVGVLAAWFPKLSGAISAATGAISTAASAVGTFLAGISAPVWAIIAAAIAAVVAVVVFLKENWDAVTAAVKTFFAENIAPKLEKIKGHFDKIVESLQPLFDLLGWLLEPIKSLIQGFKDWWSAAEPLSVLGEIFETIGGVIFAAVSGTILGTINTFIGAIENVVQVFSGVTQIVSGVWDFIVALFTGGDIGAAWEKIWDGVVDVVKGVWGLIFDPIKNFVGGIIDWFATLWDELSGSTAATDFVSGIFDMFKDFGANLLEKIKDGWAAVKEWWNSKPGLKKISTKIEDIKDKVSTAWDKAKTWWSDKKEKLKTYTPSIGSIYETVKERWNTAKNWWAEKKEKLSTYTPSIGSIKDKVSGAWDTAKTWWKDKKAAMASYTPNIGDIKAKVSSAWNTAKDWWAKTKSAFSTYTPNIGDIKAKVSSAWTTAKNWWSKSKSAFSSYTPSIGSIKDKVSSAWTTARSWWSNTKTGMSTYTPAIGSIKTALINAWNAAKKWWNDNVKLSIPSLSFKVTYTTSGLNAVQKAVVNALNLNGWPKLSFAASGGIFDAGSLIWAGESGAEVVANAGGGKTGVMNVQQMQEAVYEGVYAAVVAAMRASGGSGGGSQDINVYLDGRQIARSVEKNQRERGATIVNNPNFAY